MWFLFNIPHKAAHSSPEPVTPIHINITLSFISYARYACISVEVKSYSDKRVILIQELYYAGAVTQSRDWYATSSVE
jgi:hypothetical protein